MASGVSGTLAQVCLLRFEEIKQPIRGWSDLIFARRNCQEKQLYYSFIRPPLLDQTAGRFISTGREINGSPRDTNFTEKLIARVKLGLLMKRLMKCNDNAALKCPILPSIITFP